MAKIHNFKVFCGDSFAFQISVQGLEGIEFDKVEFTVRSKIADHIPVIYKSNENNNGIFFDDNSKYTIKCLPEDSENITPTEYVYDVQITLGENVFTVLYGNIEFVKDVTRRNTNGN